MSNSDNVWSHRLEAPELSRSLFRFPKVPNSRVLGKPVIPQLLILTLTTNLISRVLGKPVITLTLTLTLLVTLTPTAACWASPS